MWYNIPIIHIGLLGLTRRRQGNAVNKDKTEAELPHGPDVHVLNHSREELLKNK